MIIEGKVFEVKLRERQASQLLLAVFLSLELSYGKGTFSLFVSQFTHKFCDSYFLKNLSKHYFTLKIKIKSC